MSVGEDWCRVWGDTPPLGHVLRLARPEKWTRFHALPESKRYAENDSERQIIRERADALADACFRGDHDVYVIADEMDDWPGLAAILRERHQVELVGEWPLAKIHDDWDDERTAMFLAAKVGQDWSRWTWLFDAVAEDDGNALFFSTQTGRVLGPYDGGFEVFYPKRRPIDLEMLFNDWMSVLPSRM